MMVCEAVDNNLSDDKSSMSEESTLQNKPHSSELFKTIFLCFLFQTSCQYELLLCLH